MLGTGSDRALSNIGSMEVHDEPTRLSSPDDERPPGHYGPCPCVKSDDGKTVPSTLRVDGLRDEMHVLRPCGILPQVAEESGESATDGLSTHELGRSGIERKESGGIGIQEVRNGVDVSVVKRGHKGTEHLFRVARREGLA